jgi:hypothetical protein
VLRDDLLRRIEALHVSSRSSTACAPRSRPATARPTTRSPPSCWRRSRRTRTRRTRRL